jgi:epoxyqueuosine reductase
MAGRKTDATGLELGAAVSAETLGAALEAQRLELLGGFHAEPDEPGLPAGTRTLLLIGPAEPGFWTHLKGQPEWGGPDPVDQWSRRVIGRIACDLGAKALFPFGGPPYHPFYTWVLRSGQVWDSPVKLLVHSRQGLMVSFRGALALKDRVALPPPAAKPCEACARPCLTACPAGALTGAGYDVPACHGFLDTAAGAECLGGGCLVRRACPVSVTYARLPEQSAYHMSRFHEGWDKTTRVPGGGE